MSGEVAARRTTSAGYDERLFPRSQTEALFAAVLIDDEIDPELQPPDRIGFDYRSDQLDACFRLSRQLWIEGFDRDRLIQLADKLLRTHDLDPEERTEFKHVRAKFKHFRYAHALYGAARDYPALLDRITITMGQTQDAYRHRGRVAVAGRAALLRLLLTKPAVRRVRAEADRLVPSTPAAFRRLLETDYATLEALLAKTRITGHAFHDARKVVGRQVSFWDTLRTLEPSEERYRMSRWLSAINGSMGALHDRLVEDRTVDAASYGNEFALPEDIRERIEMIADCARRSLAS